MNVKFTLGEETFTFSCGRNYPVYDPAGVNVPVDYSDGGQLYAYDKGVAERFINLSFDNLTAADYANFENWLTQVAVGPKNTFTLTDEAGVEHTVRLLDTKNPLRAVAHGKYGGTIMLREEI